VQTYDLAIIGGGINGAGIARDAAGRGLSVLLVERDDLASHTSSASSKLIHGGLRYLEQHEFRLVAEALAEREVLLGIAPHLIHPLRFVLPHAPHLRPAWMIRMGLYLYDRLGGGTDLPGSRGVDFRQTVHAQILQSRFRRGFEYSDAWVDDARLVVLNARAAADKGAMIRTRTTCIAGRRDRDRWHLKLRDQFSGDVNDVLARAVVNAAGPWAERVLRDALAVPPQGRLRLVKGSHIVVPRLYDGEHAYILQNPDKRVVFVLPYEAGCSAIGTTDVAVEDPDAKPVAGDEEIRYLCETASSYLAKPVRPADVIDTWSGVRALYDDGETDPSAVSRDYKLMLDEHDPPLLSVFGGKITTYRKLAEQALEQLAPWFPKARGPWTGTQPLPGGDFGGQSFAQVLASLQRRHPALDRAWLHALLCRHGTLAATILGDAQVKVDLGQDFGGGLCEREVEYLCRCEWAMTPEDVLWRRTKAGLRAEAANVERLAQWFARRQPS
jgi:glycerol-3-phosphate dehydrogenase